MKFTNVKFSRSKAPDKQGQLIAGIIIQGEDVIILVPKWFQKKIKLHVAYDIECKPLQTGKGFVVSSYNIHVKPISVILLEDMRSLIVRLYEKETKFSYDVSGKLSPKSFFDKNKIAFMDILGDPDAYNLWRKYLQDISQAFYKFEFEWDETLETSPQNIPISKEHCHIPIDDEDLADYEFIV